MKTTLPKGMLGAPKELDPFIAGWEAAQELEDHEWGPSPPKTPLAAKRQWEGTCNYRHIIRVDGCKACKEHR